MTVRLDVNPRVLEWAVRRSGRAEEELWNKSHPRSVFDGWVSGKKSPTYKQLQTFAKRTYTPFGYLLLDEPPAEEVPIADFRQTPGEGADPAISVNLRNTIYSCQDRLDWWRSHRRLMGELPPSITGSMTTDDDPLTAAERLADVLDWTSQAHKNAGSWDRALAQLRDRIEALGILVVISGIVDSNTHRTLDVEEFRGFALVESGDALIFVNGRDAKAAQIFTLAHELAHVLLAAEGISDLAVETVRTVEVERWCNRVAAELLVPGSEFRATCPTGEFDRSSLDDLARLFRVSRQVVLGRYRELGYISWARYLDELATERARVDAIVEDKASSGGNYYNSRSVQLSKSFAQALIGSTLEGHTPYTEAFRLLGVTKTSTFDALGERLGVT